MTSVTTRQVHLARRPQGRVQASDFEVRSVDLPNPGDGQVLVRTRWLSIDPMLRIFIDQSPLGGAMTPLPIGAPIVGPVVAEVVESRSGDLSPGDLVEGRGPWQERSVLNAGDLRRLGKPEWPAQAALGVLGLPGFSAYVGLKILGAMPAGSTVLISGAAGAVGTVAGQLVRRAGWRAVGIASGAERCDYLVRTLGFDGAADRNAADFKTQLQTALPNGANCYFDNVGGPLFPLVLPFMAHAGVVLICGLMAQYESGVPGNEPGGVDQLPDVLRAIMGKQLMIRAFNNRAYLPMLDEYVAEVGPLVASGKITLPEIIHDGLDSAPAAFATLFSGGPPGKHLIRL